MSRQLLSENKKRLIERYVEVQSKKLQQEAIGQLNEWPDWLDDATSYVSDKASDLGNYLGDASSGLQDIGQGALGIVGLVPGVGNFADLANAGWSAARGNMGDAALNLAAAVPGVGLWAGGTNLANKGNNLYKGLKTAKAIKTGIKPAKSAFGIGTGAKDVRDSEFMNTPTRKG